MIAILVSLNTLMAAQSSKPGWAMFRSKGGWSILYPKGWVISSCIACPDPTTPGVFDLFAPKEIDGTSQISVNVDSFDSLPDSNLEDRLASIESALKSGRVRVSEKKQTVHGLLAMSVLYRHSSTGWEIEHTLIAAGAKTYIITCQEFGPGQIEMLPNFDLCRKMRASFRLQNP
jgi:hypothetical protein